MINIKIICTSYLIPNNNGWSILKNNYNLIYSDYGNTPVALYNADTQDAVVLVIFFEDIISIIETNKNNYKNILNILIDSIMVRCNNSNKPTLIYLGNFYNENSIRVAKGNDQRVKIYDWFFNEIKSLTLNFKSLYFINLNQLYSDIGFDKIYDDRNWYFAHCRLSSLGINTLSNSIFSVMNRHFTTASKVLVLDCDNTIWGGVIGEDGINELNLGQDGIGQTFVDFQKEIKKLIDEGLIIVLSSKNNEEEVWSVFDNHPSMILQKKDIVTWRINWQEKSQNIISIANELELGLDTFVFWDDNPIERQKVRAILPEVYTIEPPNDVYKWPRIIRNLEKFAKFEVTVEDKSKTAQYHGRSKFVRDVSKTKNIIEYLKGIHLLPVVHNLNTILVGRAVQLCLKTNQYNLRTIRHSAEELLKLNSINNDFTFLVSLTDDYGDHGNIALVCLEKLDEKYIFINTFLMSCRVLGRYLEVWILNEIILRAVKNKYEFIIGEYIPTNRNIVAKDLFINYGFNKINSESLSFKNIINTNLSTNNELFILNIKNFKIPSLEIYEKN